MTIRQLLTYRHNQERISGVFGFGVCGGLLGGFSVMWKKWNALAAFLVLCCVSSCENNTLYHTYRAIQGDLGWYRSDSLDFDLPSGLPPSAYTLEIGIRNTGVYPYKDIWLAVMQVSGDGVWGGTADTLHLYLADEKGRWDREGSVGGYYQSTFVCEKPFVVGTDSSGRSLRVVHVMQDDPLPGISDVGIRLLKK